MRRILRSGCVAVVLFSAVSGFGRGKETPEEVVTAYVAALDAKDERALRALYHPNSDFRLSALQRQFFDDSFKRELERTASGEYTSELTELERGVLPMDSIVEWASNPLMQMTVSYTDAEGREVQLIRFLSRAGKRWFIAFPMPNAKMLGGYEAYLKDKAEGRLETESDSASGTVEAQSSNSVSGGTSRDG